MLELYSSDTEISSSAVPDEISYCILVSGCSLHCDGCHSSYAWDKTYGEPLLDKLKKWLQNPLSHHISCITFYGGEWNPESLVTAIELAKKHNKKVCLFTGEEDDAAIHYSILKRLDYLKLGSYKKELGGLDSPATNQRLLKKYSELLWEDVTHLYHPKFVEASSQPI